jgi:hypothetical protein
MEIPNILKTLKPLEIILLVCFIIYIIMPISMPQIIAGLFDSSLGMLLLFIITLFLFFYVNPILGVVFIFVAYEMLRRSSNSTGRTAILQYTPSQAKKDQEMQRMNPSKKETLEEEIVEKMAPIGKSEMSVFTPSTFKPVADDVGNASLV